jgi:hypothetical protein
MVNQNFILYVNENRMLRQAFCKLTVNTSLTGEKIVSVQTEIPEKHFVCGFIFEGLVLKAKQVKNFPFQPIEKYLFETSNIQFLIPDLEFSQANKVYDFEFVYSDIYPVESVKILEASVPPFEEIPPFEENPPTDNGGGSGGTDNPPPPNPEPVNDGSFRSVNYEGPIPIELHTSQVQGVNKSFIRLEDRIFAGSYNLFVFDYDGNVENINDFFNGNNTAVTYNFNTIIQPAYVMIVGNDSNTEFFYFT